MRTALLLAGLIALVGCGENNPPVPGGGGGGGGGGAGGGADASVSGADATTTDGNGATVSGFVCLVIDPRDAIECPTEDSVGQPLDLSGISVTEVDGTGTTTTLADGAFSLSIPSATSSVLLLVSHTNIRTSAIRILLQGGGATEVIVPAMDASTWTQLSNALGVVEADDHGAAAVYIRRLLPIAGAEIIQPAAAIYPPFYDLQGPFDWTQNGLTGMFGAAVLFAIPVPLNQTAFSVIGPGGSPNLDNLPLDILDATTTFIFIYL